MAGTINPRSENRRAWRRIPTLRTRTRFPEPNADNCSVAQRRHFLLHLIATGAACCRTPVPAGQASMATGGIRKSLITCRAPDLARVHGKSMKLPISTKHNQLSPRRGPPWIDAQTTPSAAQEQNVEGREDPQRFKVAPRTPQGVRPQGVSLSDHSHVLSARPLRSLSDVVRYLLSLTQFFKAHVFERRAVKEHVLSCFIFDETKPFVHDPFDCPFCHVCNPILTEMLGCHLQVKRFTHR